MAYYFAYGSNMSHKQMEKRCPGSQFVKAVCLRNYKFVYDGCSMTWKGAVANIIKSPGDIVWGGLYEISEEHLKSLDGCEGYPNSYQRRELNVDDDTGTSYSAITYYRNGKTPGSPSEEYEQTVINGANDCRLDPDYIEKALKSTPSKQS